MLAQPRQRLKREVGPLLDECLPFLRGLGMRIPDRLKRRADEGLQLRAGRVRHRYLASRNLTGVFKRVGRANRNCRRDKQQCHQTRESHFLPPTGKMDYQSHTTDFLEERLYSQSE